MIFFRITDDFCRQFVEWWIPSLIRSSYKDHIVFYTPCEQFLLQLGSNRKYDESNWKRLDKTVLDMSQTTVPGGMVVVEPDCLWIGGYFKDKSNAHYYYNKARETLKSFFKKRKLEITFSATNDVLIGDKKIAGGTVTPLGNGYFFAFGINATVNNRQIKQVSTYAPRIAVGYKEYGITKEEILAAFDWLKPLATLNQTNYLEQFQTIKK